MTDTPAAPPARRTFAEEVKDMALTIGGGLAIALVLRVLIFQPFTIPSDSMEPGMRTGDYIVVSKWDYGWSRYSLPFGLPLFEGRILKMREPQRGDIVVFKLPRDPSEDYIKRIIGTPGDRVQVKGGVIWLNDRPIPRTEAGWTRDPGLDGLPVERYVEHRPDGHPYVTWDQGQGHEGDNTEVFVVPEGHYLMIGDNRDNSLDSRWPEAIGVGYVPAENIVGRARFSLISWSYGASLFKPWTWVTHLEPDRFFRALN